MSKREAENNIKRAIASLGVDEKSMYSAKELDDIAAEAKVDTYYVMMYLRFGRIL